MPLQSDLVRQRLLESNGVRAKFAEEGIDSVIKAAHLMVSSFREGKKLLLCGNGGSAADCQHMAAEFVSRLTKNFNRPAIPAIALTTDTSFLTAFSNDCGYEGIFERQVEALGISGDVLLGISTSGGSKNVVNAFTAARSKGMKTIALIGSGGALSTMADVTIAVPSTHTQYVQECHLSIEHSICELVEQELYGKSSMGGL